ncbi:unnamed protein product, partial [Staurois parvus]
GLHSVSSTPLCQSLHWPPFSVLHPSLPIPPLASTQCPPSLSANPSTGLHSVVLHPSLPIPTLASTHPTKKKFKILTTTYKAIHNSQDLLLSSSRVSSSLAHLQDFS